MPYREIRKTAKEPLSKRDPKIIEVKKMSLNISRRKSMAFLAAVMMVTSGAALGVGTFSYFSDIGQVNNNVFTAGTIDMKLSPNSDGTWSQSLSGNWGADNFAPGDTMKDKVWIKNKGSLDGNVLLLDFEKSNYNKTFAQNIKVWIASGKNASATSYVSFGNLDDYINMQGDHSNWDFIVFKNYNDTDNSDNLTRADLYKDYIFPAGTKLFLGLKFKFMDNGNQNGLQGATTGFDLELKTINTNSPVTRGTLQDIPN